MADATHYGLATPVTPSRPTNRTTSELANQHGVPFDLQVIKIQVNATSGRLVTTDPVASNEAPVQRFLGMWAVADRHLATGDAGSGAKKCAFPNESCR